MPSASIEKTARISKPKVVLVLTLWLAVLVLSYWYFFVRPQQWFDTSLQNPAPLSQPDIQRQVLKALNFSVPTQPLSTQPFTTLSRPLLVRLRQPDCNCERYVDAYYAELNQRLAGKVDLLTLNPADDSRWRHWLPATPAALVFAADGSLAYAGPFHQEGLCNAANSYLEPILAGLLRSEPPSVTVNTLAFGCFCAL